MLVNGQFIKEEPPKIGSFYVPRQSVRRITPEERFVQNILLGIREGQASFLSKVFGLILKV